MAIQRFLTTTRQGPMPVFGRGDLTTTAWGTQKASADKTIMHGLFSHGIPATTWKELWDDVEQIGFSKASSVNGKLHLEAGTVGQSIKLQTFQHPRYQPNRGHLFSTSVFLPNPEASGIRRFGLGTSQNGIFFELDAGTLYAVRRTTVDGTTTDYREKVENLPDGLNLANGCTFDIQIQWRGVGNVLWFAGSLESSFASLIHEMRFYNTSSELLCADPAMPVFFESINTGEPVTLEVGCFDLTTEGGNASAKTYGSLSLPTLSGEVQLPGPNQYNTPILAVHNKEFYGSAVNTRDVLNLSIAGHGDQRTILRVWHTRDSSALSLGTQSWQDYGDGHLEYAYYDSGASTPISLDTAKATLQYSIMVPANETFETRALFEDTTALYVTPGDYLVFTMHRDNGGSVNVGLTYEFAEEV